MPSAAFLTWLAAGSAERVVLVDVAVAEHLRGWTLQSGIVYKVTWLSQVQTTVALGGFYRRLDGVNIDGAALTLQSSIANVQANPGSYFYDTATKLLYVSTIDSLNPEGYSSVRAAFTFFVSTHAKAFVGGTLYEPRITGSANGQLEARQSEPLLGVVEYPSGTLVLANGDGAFDVLSRTWLWEGGRCLYRSGGDALAFSDYETVATMEIARAAAGDQEFVLQLLSLGNAVQNSFDTHTLTDFIGPTLLDGAVDALLPIVFGSVRDVPMVFRDYRGIPSSGTQWMAYDPFLSGGIVTAVRAVNTSTGQLVEAVAGIAGPGVLSFITSGASVTTFGSGVTDAYPIAAWTYYCDITGFASTFGSVVTAVLQAAGVDATDIDAAAMAQADLDAPFTLGLVILETGVGITDVLNQLERSVLGSVHQGVDGLWSAQVWDPSADPTTLTSLVEADLSEYEVDDQVQDPMTYKVTVTYAYNARTETASRTSSSSTETQYDYPSSRTMTVDTLLQSSDDAALMADRFREIGARPTTRLTVTLPPSLWLLRVWDKVLVTKARGPDPSGAFSTTVYEIEGYNKQTVPMAVTASLGNQRGLDSRVKRAMPDALASLTYANATTAQRIAYGWALDDATQRADVSDPASFRQCVAW